MSSTMTAYEMNEAIRTKSWIVDGASRHPGTVARVLKQTSYRDHTGYAWEVEIPSGVKYVITDDIVAQFRLATPNDLLQS